MNILLTGITGYIGSRLAPRLRQDGHQLRGMSRHPQGEHDRIPMATADAISGAGLEQALEGIDVAYYLIHSMETTAQADGAFDERERAAVENFADAAVAAGVRRIVYLGGLVPDGGPVSPHLTSRLAVEETLLAMLPDSVAFRASVVIGARSRAFRFLVRLVERLPVLAVPSWHANRTQPIDERDMVEMLARAATSDRVRGQSLDVGGPDVVSYGELIDTLRDHMLVDRPTYTFKRLTVTPIASRLASIVAGEDPELIGPLMESLGTDLLVRDNRASELLDVRMHSLGAAIDRALREWESVERLGAR